MYAKSLACAAAQRSVERAMWMLSMGSNVIERTDFGRNSVSADLFQIRFRPKLKKLISVHLLLTRLPWQSLNMPNVR
jgi:hypothetical protein